MQQEAWRVLGSLVRQQSALSHSRRAASPERRAVAGGCPQRPSCGGALVMSVCAGGRGRDATTNICTCLAA